jgi:5-methylcytosine-specific restriction endonuclease McrA
MTDPLSLREIPDDELLCKLVELLRDSRRTEADLVAHIGEVDKRRLYAREAAPSMFAYCTRVLHLSEAEAYLRIVAARAARRHPVLLTMLAGGRLHLSGIAKLAPHLTPENRDTILSRATHRSKRQIEELIAEICPRPDVPALIRKLPQQVRVDRTCGEASPHAVTNTQALLVDSGHPATQGQSACPQQTLPDVGHQLRPGGVRAPGADAANAPGSNCVDPHGPDGVHTHGPERVDALRPDGVSSTSLPEPSHPACGAAMQLDRQPRASAVEPLAPSRYKVQFTASAELRDKLERLQALLRSEVPDGDLGAVIERAVTEALQRHEARRYAQRRPTARTITTTSATIRTRNAAIDSQGTTIKPAAARKPALSVTNDSRPSSSPQRQTGVRARHIPAAIRRAVYQRDGGRCRYLGPGGRRCDDRHRLEYHHVHPFGRGGAHAIENIVLMCRTHNLYLAERDYGAESIAPYRRPIGEAPWGREPRAFSGHAMAVARGRPGAHSRVQDGRTVMMHPPSS